MTVIVAGSAGYKGSQVAKRLLQLGRKVIGIDSYIEKDQIDVSKERTSELEGFEGFKFYELDVVEDSTLENIKKDYKKVDYIINFASEGGHLESLNNPKEYIRNNVLSTINLLELAKHYKVRKFIQGSAASVYGSTKKIPFIENHYYTSPVNPYGASKLASESMCEVYSHNYDIPVIIFRFFSVYGPGMPSKNAIPRFIKESKEGKIHSVHKDVSRDYVYISDIVDAVVESLSKRLTYQVINISSGKATTAKDLIDVINGVSGLNPQIEFSKPTKGDMEVSVGDNSKAKKMLGFVPKVDLESGISLTWDSLR